MHLKVSSRPIFVLLLPVFYFLHRYIEYLNYISFTSFCKITLIYILVILAATGFFYLIIRRWLAAAIAATFTLVINFFFGFFYDKLNSVAPNGPLTRYSIICPLIIVLIVLAVIILKRKREQLRRLGQYLNLLLALLLVIEILSLAMTLSSRKPQDIVIPTSEKNNYQPNVFLIILDGYAGSDQLKDQFSFDNSAFYDSLRTYGFYTFPSSTSNYNYTPLSIASILQMDYPDSTKISEKNITGSFKYATDLINHNPFLSFFQHRGYQLFNHSIFRVQDIAPHTGGSHLIPADSRILTSGTFATRFEKDRIFQFAWRKNWKWYIGNKVDLHRHYNERMIELTRQVAKQPVSKPRIVYTHLWMPHDPYYYNENGQSRGIDSLKDPDSNNMHAFLGYLKYTSKTALNLIREITSHDKNAIVVLMSDHGFRLYDMTKWKRDLVFSNLVSFRTPQSENTVFPDTISNVNALRFLLNHEFNAQLPMKEVKHNFIHFSKFNSN